MELPIAFLRKRSGWFLLFLLALVLSYARVPLVSAQGTTLVSPAVVGALPLDYSADVWSRAAPITFPLAAQNLWIPRGGGSVTEASVRSLTNGTWVAFLVEWSDSTQDAGGYRTEDFPDAVAVQIAGGTAAPFACMGQADSQVQIWQWRANRDVFAGADPSQAAAYPYALADFYPFENESLFYPGWEAGNFLSAFNATPVQSLIAGGPGSLTSASSHTVFGRGVHVEGRWHVVFMRPLPASTTEEGSLEVGGRYSVAVAVWEGSSGDRNGQKSTSSWATMVVSEEPAAPFIWIPLAVIFIAVAAVFLFTWLIYSPRRRGGPEGKSPEDESEGGQKVVSSDDKEASR